MMGLLGPYSHVLGRSSGLSSTPTARKFGHRARSPPSSNFHLRHTPPLSPAIPMSTDRLLHLLRGPAASPAPADRRGPHHHPHRLSFPQPQAEAGTRRRVSMSCSSTSGEEGGMTYKGAGVDIDAGAELLRRIRKMTPRIGGFDGHYISGNALRSPCLC